MSLELARTASDLPIPDTGTPAVLAQPEGKIGCKFGPKSWWNPERVEQLMKLSHEGLSAAIIGDRLGISRNSVIGRLHRMGLTKRQPTTKLARMSGPKRADGNPRSDGSGVVVRFRPRTENLKERIAAIVPLCIELADLQPHHCRYPYGEGPYYFCGHKKADGSSYCADHFALTWRARE